MTHENTHTCNFIQGKGPSFLLCSTCDDECFCYVYTMHHLVFPSKRSTGFSFRWHCPRTKNGDLENYLHKLQNFFSIGPFLGVQSRSQKFCNCGKIFDFWVTFILLLYRVEINFWFCTIWSFFVYDLPGIEYLRIACYSLICLRVPCWFSIIISNRKNLF